MITNPSKRFVPWVQATDSCNLACPYCYIAKQPRSMEDQTYQAINRHFLNLLKDFDEVSYRIAGGEPLIAFEQWRPHLEWFLAQSKGRGTLDVLTNLCLLKKDHIRFFLETDAGISVSLDGFETSKPDLLGQSSAATVKEGILKLLDSGIKNDNISITTVITPEGLLELPKLAKWIARLDLAWFVQINHFFNGEIPLYDIYFPFEETLQVLGDHGYDLHKLRLNNMNPFLYSSGCGAGCNSIAIDTQGNVFPCQTAFGQQPIANVHTSDNLLSEMKAQCLYNVGQNFRMPDECSTCLIQEWCGGGCKLNNLPHRRKAFCYVAQHLMKLFMESAVKQTSSEKEDTK